MIKYSCNVLFRRPCMFHKYNLVFSKSMFIRSIDKPNADKVTNLSQKQPFTKYFVLDFEATCDNSSHALKPQVVNFKHLF